MDRTRQMEKLIDETGCADVTIHKVFRIGVLFEELIDTIEDAGADIMVVGPKGRSDLAGVIFGSNAEYVFRRYPVPFLSVKQKQ